MGRKQARDRKCLLFYVASTIILYFLFPSCVSVPICLLEQYNFNKADSLMNDGQYAAALAENKRILSDGPLSINDMALYRIALIYTHDTNNFQDIAIARKYFTQIVDNFPESSYRNRAKLWIQMIDKLENSQKEITSLVTYKETLIKTYKNLREINTNLTNENNGLKNDIENREKKINLLSGKIMELEAQIENLKQIDLGLEQKKSKGVP